MRGDEQRTSATKGWLERLLSAQQHSSSVVVVGPISVKTRVCCPLQCVSTWSLAVPAAGLKYAVLCSACRLESSRACSRAVRTVVYSYERQLGMCLQLTAIELAHPPTGHETFKF